MNSKHIFPILIALVAAVGGYYFATNNNADEVDELASEYVTEMVDFTDKPSYNLSSDEVLSLFSDNEMSAKHYRLRQISNVDHGMVLSVHLPPFNPEVENDVNRRKTNLLFRTRVDSAYQTFQNSSFGLPHSSIGRAFIEEARLLSKVNGDRKTIVLRSDLMENTPDLSFYDKGVLQSVQNRDDRYWNSFTMFEDISFAGIRVVVIHSPIDASADSEFRIVCNYYRYFVEKCGGAFEVRNVSVSETLLRK